MEPAESARLEKIVEQHVAQLGEHFESVQIIVTTRESGQSGIIFNGSGCYFSRWAAARSWVLRQDEQARDQVRERE